MKKMIKTSLFLTTLVALSFSVLAACSDVSLSYGVGAGGLTSISDRNLNAALPGAFENLDGLQVVPTPTPHRGIGDGVSGEGANPAAPIVPPPTEPGVTPSAAPPTTTVPQVQGSTDSGEGRFKLRLIPAGPIELSNFGDRKLVQLFLNDLDGNTVDVSAYTFVWEFEDPKLAQIDEAGKYVISKTDKGLTRVKISVKEDPDTFIIVDVLIGQAAPSSGGGGGGGGGGSNPVPTAVPTPDPTPTPTDRVTGVVIFS